MAPCPVHVVWCGPGQPWADALLPGEGVRSVDISEQEGVEPTCRLTVERPSAGLLAASRPSHAWVVATPDDGGPPVPLFYGRVVGAPRMTSGQFATVELDARPDDLRGAIAAALAPLKVAPEFDPLFLRPEDADDPAEVLDGWPRVMHVDRVTGAVSTVDIVTGTDAAPVVLDPSWIDGQSVEYSAVGAPLPHVDLTIEAQWTQRGTGVVDLGAYLRKTHGRTIKTLSPDTDFSQAWWTMGETLGPGYTALSASLAAQIVLPRSWPGVGFWHRGAFYTYPLQTYTPYLTARWEYEQRRVEAFTCRVTGTAQAVGQASPEPEALALRLPDVGAVGEDGSPAPLGAVGRASFFLIDRGRAAAAHGLHVAATRIIASQRCIRVSFRLPGLRREALALTAASVVTVPSPLLPGGQATGKIESMGIRKGDGTEEIHVTLAVSVGHVPEPVAVADGNGYVEDGYVTPGYIVAAGSPIDLGVSQPLVVADWSDQMPTTGLVNLTSVTAADLVVESSVEWQAAEQEAAGRVAEAAREWPTGVITANPTRVTVTLRPMAPGEAAHTIAATVLQSVGAAGGIDLSAE